MRKVFNPDFAGLQIDWKEDREIEYLGTSVLSGRSFHTAATCKRGKILIHYLYPIDVIFDSPIRLILKYDDNPERWKPNWGWEVCRGRLIIDFEDSTRQKPISLSFWHEENNKVEELKEDQDWVYISSNQSKAPVEITPRGRIQTSRLERPLQQAIRNLLISEHGRCQVTGTQCPRVLEACHILPVKNGGSDVIENTLLLRRDIHALFDAGLLHFRLVSDQWVVEVDSCVTDSAYRDLHGTLKSWPSCHPYFEARAKLGAG
ncbi:MAG: HNH endonuclease signature motif containing protein [Pseudomonadota bacterium]